MCSGSQGFVAWPARFMRPKACLAASWVGSLSLPEPDRVRIAIMEAITGCVEAPGWLA